MFETDLEVLLWAGCLHGGFLLLLFLCLLLHCCSCWPRNHHKRVQLAMVVKSRIRAVVESRMEGLRAAVKKVIMARLDDGSLEFSDKTEGAESGLFLLVRGLLDELREGVPQDKRGEGLPKDQLTFLHRCVKKELQASPYELRGSRRAAVLSDFIQKALKRSSIYSPGFMSKAKRCCCFPTRLLKLLGLRHETKVFAAILLPVVLVALDLSSDGGMVYTMGDYGWTTRAAGTRAPDNSTGTTTAWDNRTGTTTAWDTTVTMANYVMVTEPTDTTTRDNTTGNTTTGGRGDGGWQVLFLTFTSGLILLGSTISLLLSNPLPGLLRGAHTAVSMGSREEEERDVALPLDTCTRHDMAISESTGEAAWQFVIQWLFYFTSVAAAVRSEDDLYKKEELTLNFSLVFSTIMGLISLTKAQYKAQMLTREFSSSSFQKVVCFLSSLCSTTSSQILITQALYAISETAGEAGLFMVLFFLPFYLRKCSLAMAVRGSPLTIRQGGDICMDVNMASLSRDYSSAMELFQLQSSRATVTKRGTRVFLQPQHIGILFRENLVAHIVMEIVSLTCLGLSLGLSDHFPEGVALGFFLVSPVYTVSPALWNFLLTAATLGPAGWVMAQVFDRFNNWLDSGSQTCGLEFNYEENEEEAEKREKEEEEAKKRKKKEEEEINRIILSFMCPCMRAEEENIAEEEKIAEEENIAEEDAEEDNEEEDNTEEDRHRIMREGILSILFKKEVPFLSVTGRWSHPEEQEEQEEQEEHNTGVAEEELEEMV